MVSWANSEVLGHIDCMGENTVVLGANTVIFLSNTVVLGDTTAVSRVIAVVFGKIHWYLWENTMEFEPTTTVVVANTIVLEATMLVFRKKYSSIFLEITVVF